MENVSAQDWLDKVNARELVVDKKHYPETIPLSKFISDFQFVADSIATQHAERHTVSFAFLVASASKAVDDWLFDQYADAFSKLTNCASNSTYFMLRVLAPAVTTSVKITRVTLHVCENNVSVLRALELNYPGRMPCSIDAFVVKGFRGSSELTDEQKISIVCSVKGHITRTSMMEAIKGYDAGVVDNVSDEQNSEIQNIYNKEGDKIGELRTSDNFINVSSILRTCGAKYSRYTHSVENNAFCASFTLPDGKETIDLPGNDQSGTIWAHHKRASHIAAWCDFDEMVEALSEFKDDTIPVKIVKDEIPDEESYQELTFGGVKATRRLSDMYVQATELCLNLGKTYGNSIHNEIFKEKKRELSRRLNIPEAKLIKTGIGKHGSSWMHAELGLVIIGKHKPDLLDGATETLNSEFESTATIVNVKDADGKLISRIRKSDGFHDVNTIAAATKKRLKYSAYLRIKDANMLVEKVKKEYGKDVCVTLVGIFGGCWNHPVVAKDFAVRTDAADVDVMFNKSFMPVEADCFEVTTVSANSSSLSLHQNASAFVKALYGDDGNMITELRSSDGYVNATKMCQSAGKLWANFYHLLGTKAFLEELSIALGIPVDKLIISTCGRYSGTWVHPDVGIELAGWCSVKFKIQVTQLVRRYIKGDLTTEESQEVAKQVNRQIQSIAGSTVPTDLPGAYLTLCSKPDESKFVFNNPIPEGKLVVGFGWSGISKRDRVEAQMAQTGDYMYLDGFDTVHGYELEKEMKAFARHAGYSTIHGTYTDSNGNKTTKTEFWSLDNDEYTAIYNHASMVLENIEKKHEKNVFNKSIQQISNALATVATTTLLVSKENTQQELTKLKLAEEITKQKDKEIEILKLQLRLRGNT